MLDPLPELTELHDLDLLGEGGMGLVRRVHDPVLDRDLALKILRPERQGDPEATAAFLREARLMARLQHPGVVPVTALGRLPDGRLGLAMQQVRGRTFTTLIDETHARGAGTHRLVELLLRAIEAVAYAHSQGVVHRDIKPDNLMVGDFGEVLVLDWGLAVMRGEAPADRDAVTGTPMYMAPEQALGEPVGPPADVYALGATLHHALSGQPPFAPGDLWAVIAAGLAGEVLPLPASVPPALAAICARAMATDPAERPADAGALAAALGAWLDDSQRRAAALAVVGEADALLTEISARRDAAEARAVEAAVLLAPLRATDPAEAKAPAWAAEDAASALRAEAEALEQRRLSLLQTALHNCPELPEALDRLADHYRARHAAAEAVGSPSAADWAALLRATGRHRDWLDGRAELVLHSEPAGATVHLYRWVEVRRRRHPELVRDLGVTPVTIQLSHGSWLLQLSLSGFDNLSIPLRLDRLGSWNGGPPGAPPHRYHLPRPGALGPDEALIPAGPFLSGGDPEAADALPAATVWLPAFVLRRDPVTVGEYAAFLDSLADPAERDARRPRPLPGEQQDQILWPAHGPPTGPLPTEALLRCPVTRVSWHDARAYAAWEAARTGLPWRLPHEWEWEKAGRGADGRPLPWGDFYEPTWTAALMGQPGRPRLAPVDATPGDESPYGVRGLSGNNSDWCDNPWRRDGPPLRDGRLLVDGEPAEFRAVRGGHYRASPRLCRLASRTAARPDEVFSNLGFRLARDWTEAPAISAPADRSC